MTATLRNALLLALAAAVLAACAGAPERPAGQAPLPGQPRDPATVPDAVPRPEPRARLGNPPFYEVEGRRYFVLSSADGYSERGVASWYGPDFHGERTATGEPYDMYSMTAAHPTLPLPTYARVTNLQNGRSVVVRINDRGPFKKNRILDLSYVAAQKLDVVRTGTAMVEVTALIPGGQAPAAARAASRFYAQAASYAEPANAARMVTRLQGQGFPDVGTVEAQVNGRRYYRVRVGPVTTVEAFDDLVARLRQAGIEDPRLASD
jgi:rare lipoprotein A